ncbi:GNAT family N-acetyltransferase [Acinetobacter seifertii]|uniref:GNAT family N-acetyltransferase n=1 Tax=Acinetobacter seifertii TaxID=1530123 RepID=A0A7H2NJY4_9GAMM|nr:GNAT family N-acetyltransferase [Acinetobacter seifertii]MBZ6533569.1 GNAT family N-acetyltransferase [Acinetobacter seifertii]QNW90916.1 GNAT family N-acetyltransferase [Acinetobacter seifertii]QNX04801.1 GNAT family N-acetyltransferase [Acinetobacter seifertii]QNX15279.1 GNAT family N-acetyltransferase [Acinetobacter seifertii]QNX72910.1 GNAT family N-acetyltransferase [Acinetobacter seifertii]
MKPLNDTDIRIATFKDALSIAEVHVQAWKETYTGMVKQEILDELNVLDKEQLWKEISRSPNHKLFIYTENGVVKGFLDGYLNPENNVAEILAFYLLKEVQKQGVGRELFQKFYQCALNQGYAFIRLEVFNKNPSRFFYEKMGAKLIGEAEPPEFGFGITELLYQWEL